MTSEKATFGHVARGTDTGLKDFVNPLSYKAKSRRVARMRPLD